MIPRPDFKRDKYIVLNGKWDFCFDDENTSTNEEKTNGRFSDYEINVPFAYQSKLSGINSQKYHEIIWYAKTITIEKEDLNNIILLKLGAVDSSCSIYVNGKHVKDHDGGYSQIDADITDYLTVGENRIVVKAVDNRYTDKPRGKQYWKDKPDRCWYTETSGIHRTCFLEFAGKTYIEYFRILPDIDTNTVSLDMSLSKPITGKLEVEISYKSNLVKDYVISLNDDHYVKETLTIKPEDDIDETTYWSIDNPNLYDIKFYLFDHNKLVDKVSSYFGLRKIEIKDNYIYLNHKPIYQRLILQQGYWKDSLTTPIDEEAIIKDLTMIKEMGFNGVRMHQKCEDPLFYYHADRLGLLVWLEMPSSYNFNLNSIDNNFRQWKEIITQNYNHPSIIAYVPINESWGVRKIYSNKEQIQFANAMYEYTKALDPSRIVSTNDGWELSAKTDIYGFHQYFGDPEQFKKEYCNFEEIAKKGMWNRPLETITPLENKPVLVSEFGGIAINSDNDSWGYNSDAKNADELKEKITAHVDAVLSLNYCCGYCYTQFSDVMQEINGLVDMERNLKLPIEEYHKIFAKDPK